MAVEGVRGVQLRLSSTHTHPYIRMFLDQVIGELGIRSVSA